MPRPHPTSLQVRLHGDSPPRTRAADAVLRETEARGLVHSRAIRRTVDDGLDHETLEALVAAAAGARVRLSMASEVPRQASMLFVRNDAVIDVYRKYSSVMIDVWARYGAAAAALAERIRDALPAPTQPAEPDLVGVRFWLRDRSDGAASHVKLLSCPTWEEIEGNYASRSGRGVERLIQTVQPDERGKIVFWHGPPGTGKTWAIRALLRAWKDRATLEVITDPRSFFGDVAYMQNVLLNDPGGRGGPPRPASPANGASPTEGGPFDGEERFRLFVMEDAADLVIAGCRNDQGFGRFLNVTDGLIGQGLRTVFLLTANEAVGQIDPALLRPGRCLQVLEFGELERAAARRWLDERGAVDASIPDPATVAALYASLQADDAPAVEQTASRVGF